jgi:hypothetical protein
MPSEWGGGGTRSWGGASAPPGPCARLGTMRASWKSTLANVKGFPVRVGWVDCNSLWVARRSSSAPTSDRHKQDDGTFQRREGRDSRPICRCPGWGGHDLLAVDRGITTHTFSRPKSRIDDGRNPICLCARAPGSPCSCAVGRLRVSPSRRACARTYLTC